MTNLPPPHPSVPLLPGYSDEQLPRFRFGRVFNETWSLPLQVVRPTLAVAVVSLIGMAVAVGLFIMAGYVGFREFDSRAFEGAESVGAALGAFGASGDVFVAGVIGMAALLVSLLAYTLLYTVLMRHMLVAVGTAPTVSARASFGCVFVTAVAGVLATVAVAVVCLSPAGAVLAYFVDSGDEADAFLRLFLLIGLAGICIVAMWVLLIVMGARFMCSGVLAARDGLGLGAVLAGTLRLTREAAWSTFAVLLSFGAIVTLASNIINELMGIPGYGVGLVSEDAAVVFSVVGAALVSVAEAYIYAAMMVSVTIELERLVAVRAVPGDVAGLSYRA